MGKGNIKNLKNKDSNQSREEAAINGRKGGQKSGESKRRRKALRELFKSLLETPLPDGILKEQLNTMGFNEEENYNTAIGMTTLNEALKGNIKAIELIRDTLGEKPKEKVDLFNKNNFKVEIQVLDEDKDNKKTK